jgi:hypothetical protein
VVGRAVGIQGAALGRGNVAFPQEFPLSVERSGAVLFKTPAGEVKDAAFGARQGPVRPFATQGKQRQEKEGQREHPFRNAMVPAALGGKHR